MSRFDCFGFGPQIRSGVREEVVKRDQQKRWREGGSQENIPWAVVRRGRSQRAIRQLAKPEIAGNVLFRPRMEPAKVATATLCERTERHDEGWQVNR